MEEKTLEEQLKEAMARIKELEELTSKQKSAIDNACSDASKHKKEAADWQEKYKATLSEQEQKELEAKQREDQILSELGALKTEKRLASYKSKLMEAGYDAETSETMAQALPEGVTDEFFEKQKSFLEAKTQELKTQALNSQPELSSGNPPSKNDAEDADAANLRRWMGL